MRLPLSFEMKEDAQCYGDILKVAYFEFKKCPLGGLLWVPLNRVGIVSGRMFNHNGLNSSKLASAFVFSYA
jgi:hypothetical protein